MEAEGRFTADGKNRFLEEGGGGLREWDGENEREITREGRVDEIWGLEFDEGGWGCFGDNRQKEHVMLKKRRKEGMRLFVFNNELLFIYLFY